jgi:hypothetical protein
MSKFVRLPLTVLAVLAALLFLPGVASGDTLPTSPTDCTSDPAPPDCTQPDGGGAVDQSLPGSKVVDPPPNTPADAPATGGTPVGGVVPNRVQGALVEPAVITPATPNCDALPGIGLPPCAPPTCDALPLDVLLPDCLPAPPPTCVPVPGLGGGFCQFPDSDCPPPPTAPTAAAVTDGTCTPPLTCDQFAQLFGFGDDCSDIPMCIPQDRVPAGFPIPIPSPPLCGPGAGGTPTPTPPAPGKGTQMPPTAAAQQPQPYYANCDDARAQGKAPVYSTDPGYRPELDSDHDGIGCEDTTQPVATTTTTQPTGTLAYTGMELGPQLNVVWTLLVFGAGLLIVGRRRA